MYVDFSWDCPHCKKINWEYCANEDEYYKCVGCKRKFYLTFSVDVEGIEEYDEQANAMTTPIMTEIEVSLDEGQTWVKMTVNTRDLNPETSPLKAGWLLKHNGQIYRVYLHDRLNRLQTQKVAS